MLKVYFGDREGSIRDSMVDSYFNVKFKPDWFEDDNVKQMVLDIDKTEVISPYCMKSPILGPIPPQYLSGGVKALILMLKTDKMVDATACGENCEEWLIRIGDIKDVSVDLNYSWRITPGKNGIYIENDGTIAYTHRDFLNKIIRYKGGVSY